MHDQKSEEMKARLLIVDPDALLRWSLSTYLSRWFRVYPTDSTDQAKIILDQHIIEAAVIYEDEPAHIADEIESYARKCNAHMRIVRTVMNLPGTPADDQRTQYIEKPFRLERLAQLLGVDENTASPKSGGMDVR